MIEHYDRELAYLRELGRGLAADFPELGYLVSGRQVDPALERLLQGAALLNARLAARLQDDLPELVHPIFESLWPQYLCPLPATTLVEVSASESALQQVYALDGGTMIRSRKVEGRTASFRTTGPLLLPPLKILDVELRKPSAAAVDFVITLEAHEGVDLGKAQLDRLAFHFGGAPERQAALHAALTRQVEWITVGRPGEPPLLTLPRSHLCSRGLRPNESLWSASQTPLSGLRLLEELFFFREKFLGVEIDGLARLPTDELGPRLEIAVHLRMTSGRSLPADPELLRLGITPAVNIGETERLDITVDPDRTEFRIPPLEGGGIYSVERVAAFEPRSGDWVDFRPLLSGSLSTKEREVPRYELLRRAQSIDSGDIHLAVLDADGRPQTPTSERLSVWAVVTDGDFPLKLGPGDLSVPTQGTPSFLRFANFGPIRAGASSAMVRGRLTRILARFVAPLETLYSLEGIRALINDAHPEATDFGDRLVLSVESQRSERLEMRMMVPVMRLVIAIDEKLLESPDEIFLFGTILREALHRADERGSLELWLKAQSRSEPLYFR